MSEPLELQALREGTVFRRHYEFASNQMHKEGQSEGRMNKQGWSPPPPQKGWPQEGAAGKNSSQDATMRTEALGIHRHLREGTGLQAGRGREAGAKSPIDPGLTSG